MNSLVMLMGLISLMSAVVPAYAIQGKCESVKKSCQAASTGALAAEQANANAAAAATGNQATIQTDSQIAQGAMNNSTANHSVPVEACQEKRCDECAKQVQDLDYPQDGKQDEEQEERKDCLGFILPIKGSHEAAAVSSAGGSGAAGLVGLAALGGAAALMMSKDKDKDKDKDKGDSTIAGGKDVEKTPDEMAIQFAQQCMTATNTMSSECKLAVTGYCAKNPDREDCKSFTASYCKPPTGGTGASNLADPYCRQVAVIGYCSNSSNSSCPSCLQRATANSATCQNAKDPQTIAACQTTNVSADVLAQQKQACPSDPIWADPDYVSISTGSVTIVTPGSSPTGGGGLGSGGAEVAVNPSTFSAATAGSGTTSGVASSSQSADSSTSAIGSSIGSSGTYKPVSGSLNISSTAPLAQGVSPAYGPSVFSLMQTAYQSQCQANMVNNCGVFSGTHRPTGLATGSQ